MKIIAIGVLAVVVTAAAIQSAEAQRRRGRSPRGRFRDPIASALDTNKDGTISAQEIANAAKSLKTLDKNKDGKLSGSELSPFGRSNRGGRRGGTRSGEVTKAGKQAPDFTLRSVDEKNSLHLASFAGKKPVALIFGSYT